VTNDLVVHIDGKIVDSNFSEYKEMALAMLDKVNLSPATDEEFLEAEDLIKKFSAAEKAIDRARKDAMENVEDIERLFQDMTEVADRIREVRLNLNRKVKAEKQRRKNELIEQSVKDVLDFIDIKVKETPISNGFYSCSVDDFAPVVKGKKSLKKISEALEAKKEEIIAGIEKKDAIVKENIVKILAVEPASLFPDAPNIVTKTPEEVDAIIKARVAENKLEEEILARRREERAAAEARRKKEQEESTASQQVEQEGEQVGTVTEEPKYKTQGQQPLSVVPGKGLEKINSAMTEKFILSVSIVGTVNEAKEIAQALDSAISKYPQVDHINLSRPSV